MDELIPDHLPCDRNRVCLAVYVLFLDTKYHDRFCYRDYTKNGQRMVNDLIYQDGIQIIKVGHYHELL